jgi:hypothetical protein
MDLKLPDRPRAMTFLFYFILGIDATPPQDNSYHPLSEIQYRLSNQVRR